MLFERTFGAIAFFSCVQNELFVMVVGVDMVGENFLIIGGELLTL